MQKYLFIFNDSPYASERTFNGLRMALNLQEEYGQDMELKLFFFADSVITALATQNPAETAHVGQLLQILVEQGGQAKLCRTCCKTRGLLSVPLIDEVEIGTLDDVSRWTQWADKVLSF